uniref:Scavenger receptor class B n=1 Tax=Glossina palpalis gambiensis TaxID=67801 RepID=A0A1B0BTQ7_9MUSC
MPQKSTTMKIWTKSRKRTLVSALGFLLSIFAILCAMFCERVFDSIMAKEMVLRPNSQVFQKWKNPPLSLNLDIYLFNWTNPADFRNLTTKPILEQCGPYRFVEKPDKVDIRWHPENSSLTYRRKSFFYFDVNGSNGSLSDEIITVNPVALSAAGKGKQWDPVRRKMVDVGLNLYQQKMSVKRTVDELLFTGYSDDMLDMARAMPLFGKDVEVPFDRFGWFYTRNGSADLTGVFNVYTGQQDIKKLGQMFSWNYKRHLGFFESYCGFANGSAGEFQPPNLTPKSIVKLFTPDMCRTIPLDYKETQIVEGIKGYKYAGGQRSVDNGSLYPENKCFCGGNCVLSGVMNISSCRFGSPVFMSYPHFYQADDFYLNQVEGLQPQADKHEFYMVLEPKTGISLEVAARFQVNMLVEPIRGISLYENIPRIFFPMIWFEQKVRITPDLAKNLKTLPYVLLGGQIIAGFLFLIGLILLCWYPIKYVWSTHKIQEIKVYPAENGKAINSKQSELKILETEKKTPDSSPLLEKNSQLKPAITPKSPKRDTDANDVSHK